MTDYGPKTAKFEPYVWAQVVNEKRPTSIAMVALAGSAFFRKTVVEASADKDEKEVVAQVVLAHFQHWRGCAGPWGKILGYIYHRSPVERWEISTEGEVLESH